MIWRIAQKELLDMSRDTRFRAAFAVTSVLLLLALAVGWSHWNTVRAERENAQAKDWEVWTAQGPRNPHSAAHFGRYLFKPAAPLAFFDRRVDSYLGVALHAEAHTQTPAQYRPADDIGEIARFGEMTAATVLEVVVPLVIVLLAFGAFAGEREQGTLRQLLSLGVAPRQLLAGKGIGVGAAILAVVLPAAAIGSLVLLSGSPAAGDTALRYLTLMAGFCLYYIAFIGIALGVSAISGSSRTALVVLLGIWAVNSLLMPRLAADFANRAHPVPDATEFFAQIRSDLRNGLDGHDPADKRREALQAKVLAQYEVSKVEDLPVNFDAIAMQSGEEYGNMVLDKHYASLWSRYERQATAKRIFAAASPLLAMQPVSMAMAGTDLAAHRSFTESAERYRRGFIASLNNHMRDHSKTGDWDWTADTAFWKEAPPFTYQPPSYAGLLPAQGANLVVLGLWALGSLLFAATAVRRVRAEG